MSEEMKKRKQLLRDFHSGLMVNHASSHIEQLFGSNKGFGVRTCQRWYKKFREGNFDLNEKPRHRYRQASNKPQTEKFLLPVKVELNTGTPTNRNLRFKRLPAKEVQVSLVTFKEEHKKTENGIDKTSSVRNEVVQKLIQRKPELTVSKVANGNIPVKSNTNTKQVLAPMTRHNTAHAAMNNAAKRPAANPLLVQQLKRPSLEPPPLKVRQRSGVHLVEADLQLPPNIAQRMKTSQSLTETHTIGEGRKSAPKHGEPINKAITVQFQNVNPELAKNTVRITTNESSTTPLNVNKRLAVAQSTPLSSPKGVIYLNPQEIFRQNFDCQKNLPQRPITNGVASKPSERLSNTTDGLSLSAAPSEQQLAPSINCDSDSEDDLVFPQDTSLPPPKVKAVVETFTTYFDLESDKPIMLNNADTTVSASTAVIEID